MIYQQSVFNPWPIESESVQAVITSPPYYALRKYDIPDVIIGGDKDCKHEFEALNHPAKGGRNTIKNPPNVGGNQSEQQEDISIRFGYKSNICKCGAWKGQYGLEPTPQMYVEHTLLWAKEAWRVLKNDGIMFLNLADSYGTKSGTMGKGRWKDPKLSDGQNSSMPVNPELNMHKCQLLIPHRVAIALVDGGWTLRNTIIWYKTNPLPESVTDRFSKKYEYVFMFTKSPNYYFDLDSVMEPLKESSIQRIKYLYGQSGEKQGELRKISGAPQGDCSHLKSKNPGDVWQIPTQPSGEKHYAMWPQMLVERMITCSTKAGDIVLDPFAGSGTTLKVAKELHRKALGIDLGYQEIQERKLSNIQKRLLF